MNLQPQALRSQYYNSIHGQKKKKEWLSSQCCGVRIRLSRLSFHAQATPVFAMSKDLSQSKAYYLR